MTAMDEPNPKSGPDDPQNPYHVTQASRIYFLPNLMTAGNLFCGFVAVIHCIQARLAESSGGEYLGHTPADHYRSAVWFIFGAAAFDMLDGRLARMGGRESLFGAEFDSLADVISFGIAPALMMFFLILSPTQGYEVFRNIGWFLGFVYLLCAAIRLARFNVITNPLLHRDKHDTNKDFVGAGARRRRHRRGVGAPSSTPRCNDKSLQRWALALPPLMGLIAVLMVSTIRYPSGKNVDLQTKTRLTPFIGFLVFVGAVVLFKEVALLGATLGYIFFGLIRHIRRRQRPKPVSHSL